MEPTDPNAALPDPAYLSIEDAGQQDVSYLSVEESGVRQQQQQAHPDADYARPSDLQ